MMPSLYLNILTPQGGCPPVHSPFSSESLPRSPGPNLITFLPNLPDYLGIFLTALVVQESFC